MRHQNVRNADEVEAREMIKGRHNMRLRQLGKPAGSRALGATLTEVAPGAVSFPRHAHHANEEAIYVLSGSGEARSARSASPCVRGTGSRCRPAPRTRTRWSTPQRPIRSSIYAFRRCMGSRSSSIPILEKSARVSPIRQARLASAALASSVPGVARSTTGRESPRPAQNSSGLTLPDGV